MSAKDAKHVFSVLELTERRMTNKNKTKIAPTNVLMCLLDDVRHVIYPLKSYDYEV